MDNREFLGNFNHLSSQHPAVIGEAVTNIVSILKEAKKPSRKDSLDSDSSLDIDVKAKAKQKVEEQIKQKYLSGDLGSEMSADVNYTLKRLVGGLTSENHGIKKGFFLAMVTVLGDFAKQIDLTKFIAFVQAETKVSSVMTNPEVHAMNLGRMMCLSAMIESGMLANEKQKKVQEIVDILIEIYKNQEFLRESIHVIIDKIFRKVTKSTKLFDHIVEKLVVELESASSGDTKLMDKIVTKSASTSLFLTLRKINEAGLLEKRTSEYADLMGFSILQSAKHLTALQAVVRTQTTVFPRLHSSVTLLLDELFDALENSHENFLKYFKSFNKILIESSIFSWNQIENMKSMTKFKYLHIGFKIIISILAKVATLTSEKKKTAAKLKELKKEVLSEILLKNSNFRDTLIRNVQMPKNHLNEVAKEAKAEIAKLLEQLRLTNEERQEGDKFSQSLLLQLFGPNSFTHFSPKKNQDLLHPIAANLNSEMITAYLGDYLNRIFTKPDVAEFYLEESKNDLFSEEPKTEEDKLIHDAKLSSLQQHQLSIQQFALNQAASTLSMFKEFHAGETESVLEPSHIMLSLNLLVKASFLHNPLRDNEDDEGDSKKLVKIDSELQNGAQFKLFQFSHQLSKLALPHQGLKKGCCKGAELWILRINKLVNKTITSQPDSQVISTSGNEIDFGIMAKIHKKNVKFVEKTIQALREEIIAKIDNEKKESEVTLKAKTLLKQISAFEALFLNLALQLLLPQNAEQSTESLSATMDDLEELKNCFDGIGFKAQADSLGSKKKAKVDEKQVEEANSVMVDFLISMLTKPQSYLRDVANACFKEFSIDRVNNHTIDRLLEIVATPNKQAGDFMEGEKDDEGEDEEDAEEVEDAEYGSESD